MPGFKTDQRLIAGRTFTVQSLNFRKSRELVTRLKRLLLPAIGDALAAGDEPQALRAGAKLAKSFGAKFVGAGLGTLARGLDDSEIEHFAQVLGEVTSVTAGDDTPAFPRLDKTSIRDAVFGGEGGLMAFYDWMAFAFEVQWGDFFDELKGRLKSLAPPEDPESKPSRSPSPTELTGKSGESSQASDTQ